ncbi:MAG: alpha/beta hydrolase-fold protein [Candidatus Sulfotelmatobacter sp.]
MRFIARHRIFLAIGLLSLAATAQDITPPIPQKLTLHSKILNEDRPIWVRTPRGYDQGTSPFPVLYLTDGPNHINEIGSTIDFLVENGRMPPLIVVGIGNTDRTRDLTPTHWDQKHFDGTIETNPTSGGGDRFIDFIQKELIPEIETHYRTARYRIFAGHSYGGLLAIHILITRPDMFNAYIAVSPSLQWDDLRTVRLAKDFFAAHTELDKTLFFSLANEGDTPNPMGDGFQQFQKILKARAPKDFRWDSARYHDEDHGSTVLRAHYAGLCTVFADWQFQRDPTGLPVGGLDGLEKHYRELSARYGYTVPVPEDLLNGFGYRLMDAKKFDEAITVFRRNVALYPGSAHVYDSLGEGYENAGKLDLAVENVQTAIAVGTKTADPNLDYYKDHLKRVTAAKAAKKK